MLIEHLGYQIDLLFIHRQALTILAAQIAHFQQFVPPYIQMDYDNRLKIAKQLVEKTMSLIESQSIYPVENLELKKMLSEFDIDKIGLIQILMQKILMQESIENNSLSLQKTVTQDNSFQRSVHNLTQEGSKETIIKLISEGRTEEVIEKILYLSAGNELYDDSILLSARYQFTLKAQRRGICSLEELQLSINQINARALEIANRI